MKIEEYADKEALYARIAEAAEHEEEAHIVVKLTEEGVMVDDLHRLLTHSKQLSGMQCKYCMAEESALDMRLYNRPVHVMTPGYTAKASDREILDLVTDIAAEVEAKLVATFMRLNAGDGQAIEEELHDMVNFISDKSQDTGIPMSHMIHPVLFAVWPILMSGKVQGQFMPPPSELQ